MYSSHIKSLLEEKLWLFQLKYSPFYAEWMVAFLPFIWLITMPYWLPKFIFYFMSEKNPLVKVFTVGVVSLVLLLLLYLYAIVGEPDQQKWKETIFKSHLKRIAIKIYDKTDNMIGGLVNRDIDINRGIFYVESVPTLYWDILKFREDKNLNFNNDKTGLMGIWKNPRSFNGVDPIGIPNAITERRGGSTLSQQLVKNFYGQEYFDTQTPLKFLNILLRKWKELNEAKIFYHNLRTNNGEEFKRWIAMYSPSLVSAGTIYGIESASAIVFGKKPRNLTETEQILLSTMYKSTYYFHGKAHDKKCKYIKKWSKGDIKRYFKNNPKKVQELTKNIESWSCIDKPRVPFAFYKDMLSEDTKGRLMIGNPNGRIWNWAGTSTSILRYEMDRYREKYPNHLVIEAKMSVDIPKNITFKKDIDKALKKIENSLGSRLYVDLDGNATDDKKQANIWVSVVDEDGEINYIYKRGNTSYKRRIGSISKIFETIALGNRGDRWNYYYCNEPFHGLHNSDGNRGGECKKNSNNNIYSARAVLGASKNLPMRSAFDKYVIKNERGIEIVEDRIENEKLQEIYNSFNLSHDKNTSLKYELSFGLTNSTPFNLQKAIHKLTHLLYNNGSRYKEAHITKSLKYKIIKDERLLKGGKESSLYLKTISLKTREMFDANTKTYMKTVLKAPISPKFHGTLRSFKSIGGFETLFIKSGTTDKPVNGETLTQSKWVAGAIRVKGKNYSFVIMVDNEHGIGKRVGHYAITRPIFHEIVKALNR